MRNLTRRAVRSAVTGVLPWIPVAFVTSPEQLGWVLIISLCLCATSLAATCWVSDPVKHLEVIDVGYFAIATIAFVASTPSFRLEMSSWIAETSTAVILIYAAASLAVARPFTSQYTAIDLPAGVNTADFARTNKRLTTMWVGVFAVQLGCLVISKSLLNNPDDPLFAWLLPVGTLVAGFVVNGRMTRALHSRHHETTPDTAHRRR